MMKSTHFIEVYGDNDSVCNGKIIEIKYLNVELNYTRLIDGFKTVAIWKIKFKEVIHLNEKK